MLGLRDPLGLAEAVAIERRYEAILDLMDGSRDVRQIRQSIRFSRNWDLPLEDLSEFVNDLNDAGFLDGDEFREQWGKLHADFIESAVRPCRQQDILYPASADELRAQLKECLPDESKRTTVGSPVVGVVCPHQPFLKTGDLLRSTLSNLPTADELDLIVLLVTDHCSGLTPYSLTRKHYETPIGTLRCDGSMVDHLEKRLPWVRREEIRHRDASAAELSAVLIAEIYGNDADKTRRNDTVLKGPPILPVLCGQSSLSTEDGRDMADDFLGQLELICESRRVLWWASAELSHIGPAYGSELPNSVAGESIKEIDSPRVQALSENRHRAFLDHCMSNPKHRPSGTAALSTLLQMLPLGSMARRVHYTAAPVDGPVEGWAGLTSMQFVKKSST